MAHVQGKLGNPSSHVYWGMGGDHCGQAFGGIDTPGSYFRWRKNFVPMFNGVERLQGLCLGVDFQ